MNQSHTGIPVPPAPETIRWLETPEQLDQWLISLPAGCRVSLDTEFERVSTFHPIPGLVQLGGAGDFWLLEPHVAEASARFRTMLADSDRPKLLYAMSEDLELFRHWLKVEPAGLQDLQIGAALAGAGFSVGYARLVESLFGETLDKSVTRSDWLSRPLSPEQQRYAVDDIRYLEPLANWVTEKLRERNLEHALAEESRRFADEAAAPDDVDRHYLKLRGGWTLTLAQQSVLQRLAAWRELECHKVDRPRNRVLSDALMIAIAERCPRSLGELNDIQGLPGGIIKRYGEHLLALVRAGKEADTANFESIQRPLTRDQQALYKQVKKCFKKVAEEYDIPLEILAPRKRAEKVIQDQTLRGQEFFEGWRTTLLGPVAGEIEELVKP
ncbi:ribonuclease D [Marinobacter litoralis]|uniref:ribonuclease D n=1 Tax=Marinobacter litoralis TaxID=187981 RepID=UPI0018EDF49B|nr:HRDC domain-containing protein [Marinobacter litoralis]MBJ6137716.1 HRDC domain-containing protein [Marinobacter litoralis]